MADKWMGRAFGTHPGAFTAKAKRAGMSVQELASKDLKPGSHASTKTKRQAALAKRAGPGGDIHSMKRGHTGKEAARALASR